MRIAIPTTPQTLSSTCTQRRARVCLTAGRMYLDICSRWATRWTCCAQTHYICPPIQFHIRYETHPLLLGGNTKSLRQEFWHQDGDEVCAVVDQQAEGMLQTWWGHAVDSYCMVTSCAPSANIDYVFNLKTSRSYICQLYRFSLCAGHEEEIFGLSASGRT